MVQDRQERGTSGRVRFGLISAAVLSIVGLAACGTSSGVIVTRASANVSTVHNATFGNILVADGKALYTLQPSSMPCDAACTKIWPELVLPSGVTTATAGSGVDAASLGTMKSGNGVLQVTYSGQALFFFAQDGPGQVTGNVNDVWGKWSVAMAATSDTTPATSPTTSTTTSSTPAPAGARPTTATTRPPAAATVPQAPATTAPAPTTTSPPPTTTTTAGVGGGGGF